MSIVNLIFIFNYTFNLQLPKDYLLLKNLIYDYSIRKLFVDLININ